MEEMLLLNMAEKGCEFEETYLSAYMLKLHKRKSKIFGYSTCFFFWHGSDWPHLKFKILLSKCEITIYLNFQKAQTGTKRCFDTRWSRYRYSGQFSKLAFHLLIWEGESIACGKKKKKSGNIWQQWNVAFLFECWKFFEMCNKRFSKIIFLALFRASWLSILMEHKFSYSSQIFHEFDAVFYKFSMQLPLARC